MLLLCLSCAIAALAFALTLWRGWPSVRVGTHPHCAACDFDLTGRPPGVGRCPECGADLAPPAATATGSRRPAWDLIVVLGVLILACATGAYHAGIRADWNAGRVRVWPSTWLVAEVERGTATFPTADELVRRIQNGSLTGATRERAVKALCRVTAVPRPSVRAGDDLPFDESFNPVPSARFSRSEHEETPAFTVYRRLERFRFGDGEWITYDRSWQPTGMIVVGMTIGRSLPVPVAQPTGPTTVEIVYAFRLISSETKLTQVNSRTGETVGRNLIDSDLATAAWEQVVRAPVTIAAAGSDGDVELIVDETIRDAIRSSIGFGVVNGSSPRRLGGPAAVRGLVIRRNRFGERAPYVDFWVEVNAPPVGLAVDAYLRHPTTGREYRIGGFAIAKGRRVHFGSSDIAMTGEAGASLLDWPDTATVVFRPSKAEARKSASVTAIWGEEIVVDDVPIRREWVERDGRATTAPASKR